MEQEPGPGEESGLPQRNHALTKIQKPWVVHCPGKIAGTFSTVKKCLTTDVLDLTATRRSHPAEDITQWIAAILAGHLMNAKTLAERVTSQGFDVYITQDINVAINYVKEGYHGQEDKRLRPACILQGQESPPVGHPQRIQLHQEYAARPVV